MALSAEMGPTDAVIPRAAVCRKHAVLSVVSSFYGTVSGKATELDSQTSFTWSRQIGYA